MFKNYDVDTFHRYQGKNWLGSEVGKVEKTITISASNASAVTEDGRKVVKSGTIFTSPYYGLLVNDIDVTDGDAIGSLMVGGYYIDANLPSTASSYVSYFASQGLFPITEGSVTRPDTGTVAEPTKLTKPTGSATGAVLSWSKNANALAYAIYSSTQATGSFVYVKDIAQADSPSYTATASGYFKIKSLGDNLYYADSDLSDAVQVTVV